MSEVIVCDTNVAIHLAIICPDLLKNPPSDCKIVLHQIVKTELHRLSKDPIKSERLKDIFDFILKNVNTYTQLLTLPQDKQIQAHIRFQKFEEGLPETNTAPSSHYDRELLILAKKNSKKLLTNDTKLHQLSTAFLGADKTWRTGDALKNLLSLNSITKETLQNGLTKMKNPYGENLNSECQTLLKELGFTFN
ncbi:type II toxin-antitoxin system VapC family toxin [bacterium]|nr:type II toxin-antitoxin system VapC family toxin [bacterium]